MQSHPYPFHAYRAPRADDGTSDPAGSGVSGPRGRDLSRNSEAWRAISAFLGGAASTAGRRAQAKRARRPEGVAASAAPMVITGRAKK